MPKLSARKWLLLRIETKARELDAKLLLGLMAAERGWGVILGVDDIRIRPDFPRGVIAENSLSPGRFEDIRAAQATGRKVVAWCEEGLVHRHSDEGYVRNRVERQSYEAVEAFFTWGEKQAAAIARQLGGGPDRLVVAGNPRFDILRPELRGVFDDRAREIRRRYGPFILVNTKFSQYNNYRGEAYKLAALTRRGRIRTKEHEAEYLGFVDYQKGTFHAFQEAVACLSKRFPGHRVVIRPHPSESHRPWQELARTRDNVAVVYEGTVAPWLLASDVSIHNNCTTGVEAYALERPSISYRPIRDPRYSYLLPNAVCTEVEALDELTARVDDVLEGRPISDPAAETERREVACHHIASLTGATSCETILDRLDGIDLPLEKFEFSTSRLASLGRRLRRSLRPLKGSLYRGDKRAKYVYTRQKFDGISVHEVAAFLESARRATGRFEDVAIAELANDIFCIGRY